MLSNLNHRVWFIIVLVFGLFVMTACDSVVSNDLPTVAVLPSATHTLEATIVAEQATLPATWTPTPTETVTPSPTLTLTYTITPSATITDTPTVTFTPSASPTQIPRPIVDLVQLAYSATILPTDYQVPFRDGIEVTVVPDTGVTAVAPANSGVGVVVVATAEIRQYDTVVNCPFYPSGVFATAYSSDQQVAQLLGCPAGNPPDTVQFSAVYQVFERGVMIWIGSNPARIYALYNDGTYQRFSDTYVDGVDPVSGGETPPAGLREPTRGFGKVWRNFPVVRGNLGWAMTEEISDTASVFSFARGMMLQIPTRGDVLALMSTTDGGSGTWKSLSG